jgi:hypothetical protein
MYPGPENPPKSLQLRDPLLTPSVPTKVAKDFPIEQAIFAFGSVPEVIDEVIDEVLTVGRSRSPLRSQ